MITIYGVGLYCPYEGGNPAMYLEKKEDAEYLKNFLERFSVAMDKHVDCDDFKKAQPFFDLDKEFKNYFGSRFSLLPWKFASSPSQFQITEHKIFSLDEGSKQILDKLKDLGY